MAKRNVCLVTLAPRALFSNRPRQSLPERNRAPEPKAFFRLVTKRVEAPLEETNMTKIARFLTTLPGLALVLSACSESKQPVTGTVAQESFSSPITTVSASRTDGTSIDATVAADGSFTLNLPKGTGYRLDFANASGATTLVFPRSGGETQWRFDVASAGSAFDIGAVRQVGDPSKLNVTFAHAKVKKNGDAGVDEGDRDVECLNGQDPVTGAVCVEDDDQGLSCRSGKHGKGHGKGGHGDAGRHGEGHAGDRDAGVCHGDGQGHRGHDGGMDDDDTASTGTDTTTDTTTEVAPSSAAVADRNLPSSLGPCTESDDENDNQ